jgi:hypothetical protein
MTTNKILVREQNGFRNNTSTEKAIYQLTNNILKALDDRCLVGGKCHFHKIEQYQNTYV